MPSLAAGSWVTGGVALAGASIIAATPLMSPLPQAHISELIQLLAGEDMVLDLVRHGESEDNVAGVIGTLPPGAPLTDLGRDQAVAVGESLYNGGDNDIDAVYASEFLRAQQTAWPLTELLAGGTVTSGDIPDGPTPILDPGQILPGLNELNAGILEGVSTSQGSELVAALYVLAPLAWMTGQFWVPQLGSTIDPNGMAFQDRFSDAVQTIYDAGDTNGDGDLYSVAFSHSASIATWVMMNVKNPDFGVLLDEVQNGGLLSNTGQVILEGNPTDGWTLISYDGHEVDQDPGLAINLFVDYRDFIVAPQMAAWHIWEAFLGGDPMEINNALQTGFEDVSAALVQFPQAVIDDILNAFPSAGSDAAGELISDAFTLAI
ncbi:histidine phosphatase family protein [Mycobacterium shimoidei]|uniref:histidine phosphatase family protein n=1 Tax=Mycobacterium shimoidei TaxID=29313 RepID=UPI00084951A0|nr:phosphoglycerate mutase family protein [Mycobacterium shimoidei]MCV7257280.1 phosphoglycerate mutase family protein [Mycobacterium shimoidei]ODR14381.1 phosphoglycerate mutase [Mycobacterium shimoidei]ORW80458.1 phosphoglycerate mutase [Mycobacterium shimoidei]